MGMTKKEETLDWLYRLRSEIYVYMPKEWLIPMNNALDVAIDTVKREEMLEDWTKKCRKFEADYEARLKADMVALLEEIDLQFDEICFYKKGEWKTVPEIKAEYKAVIQKKINAMNADK